MNQKNLDLATRRIQSSMTQIVHIDESNKIEPLGSAIFLELHEKKRLLSAGHLLNANDYNNLLMPLKGTQEGLYIDTFGELITTNKEGDQENNKIDFAEITFTREDKISRVSEFYTFIHSDSVEYNHRLIKDDNRYFIFGYPNSRTRLDYQSKKEINAEPVRIVTYPITDESFYTKYGYNIETHILLWIQRKLLRENERVFIPKTKGISGCGVYFLQDLKSENESNEFKLVGVLTEVDFEKQFAVVMRMETIYGNINASYLSPNPPYVTKLLYF